MTAVILGDRLRLSVSSRCVAKAEPTCRGEVQPSSITWARWRYGYGKPSTAADAAFRRTTTRRRRVLPGRGRTVRGGQLHTTAVAQPSRSCCSQRSEGDLGVTGTGLVQGWSERYSSIRRQILDLGTAGACTLVLCNATYFLGAFLFVWCNVLHVPKGLTLASAGVNVAEAFGITYASCQVTKLPRIVGTLLLVPAVQFVLQRVTGGDSRRYRRVFLSLLVAAIATVFGSIAFLVLLSM